MPGTYARAHCLAFPDCHPCLPGPPRLPRLSPLPAELTEKRKTYTFFLLTDDVAAANSSGGPKTLMYRVRE
jgi:hypothetical protein